MTTKKDDLFKEWMGDSHLPHNEGGIMAHIARCEKIFEEQRVAYEAMTPGQKEKWVADQLAALSNAAYESRRNHIVQIPAGVLLAADDASFKFYYELCGCKGYMCIGGSEAIDKIQCRAKRLGLTITK